MRVANYYRVSTKLQQDRYSLSAQKTELHAYAARQEWEIVGEYKDVETGGTLDKKGLNALLDAVENGRVDIVLCMDQDRLSRLDTVSWEYLKSVLRDNNVKIAEPTGTITDLDNEDDEFMSDLRNLIARREKRSVVKRMMYGKRQRLREGKGWGVGPFEYEYHDGKYYVKKEWAWVIPFIDDLYINKRYGIKRIINELDKVSLTPTGKKWNHQLIFNRLDSKAFHGIQEKAFGNGEVISVPGVFEPLRTEKSYNKIQEIRKKRREQFSVASRTSTVNINLLKYVPITCGSCGRVISIQQMGTAQNPQFRAGHRRPTTYADNSYCGLNVNAKRYEYNLIKAIKDILTSEELSMKYINFESNPEEVTQLETDIERFEEALLDLGTANDRLLDLYLIGRIDKELYLEKEKDLKDNIKINTEQLQKKKRQLAAIQRKEWDYDSLYGYIEVAGDIGVDLSRHEQARLIGNLFTQATLSEEQLTITTEIYNNIPVDIKVPVEKSTATVNKWIRRDIRNNTVIYTP